MRTGAVPRDGCRSRLALPPGQGESVLSVSSSPIKFGVGALAELGSDAQALGVNRVALFVDPHVLASAPGEMAPGSRATATSNAFISLGGRSVMDTAKAANLVSKEALEEIYRNALRYRE